MPTTQHLIAVFESGDSLALAIWNKVLRAAAFLNLAGIAVNVFGGTIITSNLPAGTAIVIIDARADGAASYNGDQSLWYHPFNTGSVLLEYTVQPGTYAFRVVDPADAAALFPSLTSPQTNQIYTAWTYNSPWIEDYLVFDSAAATNHSLAQIFDGASGPGFNNAADAYNDAVSKGYYDAIRPGPLGRDGTNFVHSYTFTNATKLILVIPDYALSDNAGGVSVLIEPTNLPPVLNITSGVGEVNLRWTTNAQGFILSGTTNLQPALWIDVTNVPDVLSSNYSVTLPVDSATRFFRLHNP